MRKLWISALVLILVLSGCGKEMDQSMFLPGEVYAEPVETEENDIDDSSEEETISETEKDQCDSSKKHEVNAPTDDEVNTTNGPEAFDRADQVASLPDETKSEIGSSESSKRKIKGSSEPSSVSPDLDVTTTKEPSEAGIINETPMEKEKPLETTSAPSEKEEPETPTVEVPTTEEPTTAPPSITPVDTANYAYQVIQLINNERVSRGLNALDIDTELMAYAQVRAAECAVLFSHERPGGIPAMICTEGSRLWVYSENCHLGGDPSVCFKGWMSSPMHQSNMMSDGTHIGVGCFQDGNGVLYYTAEFGLAGIY